MPRAALFTLLVASVLNGSLQAQRATATFHGNAAGQTVRSGFAGQRASQTDSLQDADSFQAVFTATTASVPFLSHILTGTTGRLGTSSPMLKQ